MSLIGRGIPSGNKKGGGVLPFPTKILIRKKEKRGHANTRFASGEKKKMSSRQSNKKSEGGKSF